MPSLLVCRVLFETYPTQRRSADGLRTLADRCRSELNAARARGWDVAHIYSHWPDLATALDGCAPLASEPVFTGPFPSLFQHDPIEAFCQSVEAKPLKLVGFVDAETLRITLKEAHLLGIELVVAPYLTDRTRPRDADSIQRRTA